MAEFDASNDRGATDFNAYPPLLQSHGYDQSAAGAFFVPDLLPFKSVPDSVSGTPDMPGFVPFAETRPLEHYEVKAAQGRERVLREIGHKNPLDAETDASLNHFAAALGIKQAPETTEVFGPWQIEAAERAVKRQTGGNANIRNSAGSYVSALGLALVKTSALNDVVSSTVHERLGHGSSGIYRPISVKERLEYVFKPTHAPVNGFFTAYSPDAGSGFEEAFAHIIETEYIRATGYTPAYNSPDSTLVPWDTIPNDERHQYNKYMHLYTPAAQALLVLCEAVPDLTEVVIASRHDDAAKVEFYNLLNSIQPELGRTMMYSMVRDGAVRRNTVKNFREGLDVALSAAGLSHEDLQAVCDGGRFVTQVGARLNAYEQATGYHFRQSEGGANVAP